MAPPGGSSVALSTRAKRRAALLSTLACPLRWISRTGNQVLRWTFGIPIHDFSANCRAIRRTTWRQIETRENTNTLLLEMILRCHFGGLRVTELPVTFLDRRYGVSKLRLSVEAPKFLMKMLFYRLSFRRRRDGCP